MILYMSTFNRQNPHYYVRTCVHENNTVSPPLPPSSPPILSIFLWYNNNLLASFTLWEVNKLSFSLVGFFLVKKFTNMANKLHLILLLSLSLSTTHLLIYFLYSWGCAAWIYVLFSGIKCCVLVENFFFLKPNKQLSHCSVPRDDYRSLQDP